MTSAKSLIWPILFVSATLLGWGIAQGSVLAMVFIPALLAGVVAVVQPRFTLLVTLAYIPVESFILKWLPGGQGTLLSLAPEVALFLAALSAVLRSSTDRYADSRVKLVFWVAAFGTIGFVSGWVAQAPTIDTIYWIRTNVRYISAALIVGAMGTRHWWVNRLAVVVSGSVLLQLLIALTQMILGQPARAFFSPANMSAFGRQFVGYQEVSTGGISGTLAFYNNFGLFCALSFVICLTASLALREESLQCASTRRSRRWMLTGALAAASGTAISGSRQSIIALFAAALVVLFAYGVRRLGSRMTPILFAAAVMLTASLLMPSLTGPLAWIPERFGQAVSSSNISQSLQTDRLFAVVRVVPAVLSSNPVLGIGPGSMSSNSQLGTMASLLGLSSEGIYFAQDVGWAGIIVQLGLAGITVLLGLLFALGRRARALYVEGGIDRAALAAILAAIAVLSVGMIASSPLLIRAVSMLFWSVVGLSLGGYRDTIDAPSCE